MKLLLCRVILFSLLLFEANAQDPPGEDAPQAEPATPAGGEAPTEGAPTDGALPEAAPAGEAAPPVDGATLAPGVTPGPDSSGTTLLGEVREVGTGEPVATGGGDREIGDDMVTVTKAANRELDVPTEEVNTGGMMLITEATDREAGSADRGASGGGEEASGSRGGESSGGGESGSDSDITVEESDENARSSVEISDDESSEYGSRPRDYSSSESKSFGTFVFEDSDEIEDENATPFDIPYSFETLEYDRFIDLSSSAYDTRILGLYTLKLGFNLRNNIINVLGFVMHQPFNDIGSDVFLKLHTLKDAFQMNLIDTFSLIPVLATVTDKDVNQQIAAVLEEVDAKLGKRQCHLSCSARFCKGKIATKKFDLRRIIAHLGYNVLIYNIFDQVTQVGVTEIKEIAKKIQHLNKPMSDEKEMFKMFNPVVVEVLREIRDGKLLFTETVFGYLLPFFPWPSNNFKITHAVEHIMLTLTNERDYMARCRIISMEAHSMVDDPKQLLVWVLTKIMDNVCFGDLHQSAKVLLKAYLRGKLLKGVSGTMSYSDSFIELNAIPDLLDTVTLDRYPVEIILAKDRIKKYIDKILPFVDLKLFTVYNYETTEAKLYAFLGFILEQNPHVNTDIKTSIEAVRSHVVFEIRPQNVKYDTLLELTNAWLSPDMLDQIRRQAITMRYFLEDEIEAITEEIYSKPYRQCESLLHCIVSGRDMIQNAKLTYASDKPFKLPNCVAQRFLKQKYYAVTQRLVEIEVVDIITTTLYNVETVKAAKALKIYFTETNPVLNDILIDVQCTKPEILLEGLNLILEKMTDLPEDVLANIKAVIAELNFKLQPKKQVDAGIIKVLQTVYESPEADKEILTLLKGLGPFIDANEEGLTKLLFNIPTSSCRDLVQCYNMIADKINAADMGDRVPYLIEASPSLEDLNLKGISFKTMSVNATVAILEAIDLNLTCSSELAAAKRHMFDNEAAIDAVLTSANCDSLNVIDCFTYIYEILQFNKAKLENVKFNILQFTFNPTTCTLAYCIWELHEEKGAVILNPLLEYITTILKKRADAVESLHIQIDIYGVITYIHKHNIAHVLESFVLYRHVVEETVIIGFLNMLAQTPEASDNVIVSIQNINNHILNSTSNLPKPNAILVVGFSLLLSSITRSPEVALELEYRVMELSRHEEEIMKALSDVDVLCNDQSNCVKSFLSHFTNKNGVSDKIIFRAISPVACSKGGDCNWLTSPAVSDSNTMVDELVKSMNKNAQKNHDEPSLLEKLTLENMLESDLAFQFKNFTQKVDPFIITPAPPPKAKPEEKDEADESAEEAKRIDSHTEVATTVAAEDKEDDTKDTDDTEDTDDSKETDDTDVVEESEEKKKPFPWFPMPSFISNFFRPRDSKLPDKVAKPKQKARIAAPKSWWKARSTDTQNEKYEIPMNPDEEMSAHEKAYERLKELLEGITNNLDFISEGALRKILKVLKTTTTDVTFQQHIARIITKMEKSEAELNALLNEIRVDCTVFRFCLWNIHDEITRHQLDRHPILSQVIYILRAESCLLDHCPHKLVITTQKFNSFIEMVIECVQQSSNPDLNTFHFDMDVNLFISFLRRKDIGEHLPPSVAYIVKTDNVLQGALEAILEVRLPEEMRLTVSNILGTLYTGSTPQYLHADNINYMITVFFGMTDDTAVHQELLVAQQNLLDKRTQVTKTLGFLPVNCAAIDVCVETLEAKLIERKKDQIAKFLLKVLRPAACSGAQCKWLEKSIQDHLENLKTSIVEEVDMWYKHSWNYLLQTDLQQIKYMIVVENAIEHYVAMGESDAESPLMGVLHSIDSATKVRYDMVDGVENVMTYMLTNKKPNRVSYRQLKHIATKLQTKTDYVPALLAMEEAYNSFYGDMDHLKSKLKNIPVNCTTFMNCVKDLINGLNFQEDPASKIMMRAIAPEACPLDKCKWMEINRLHEFLKSIKALFSKKIDDPVIPIIVKTKMVDLMSKLHLFEIEKIMNTTTVDQLDSLVPLLKTMLNELPLGKHGKLIVEEIMEFFETSKVPTTLRYMEFHLIVDEMMEATHDAAVKSELETYQDMFARYSIEIESMLSKCTLKCVTLAICVNSIILCAEFSQTEHGKVVVEGLKPPSCQTVVQCPWMTTAAKVKDRGKKERYDIGDPFPNNLIIFPPSEGKPKAITMSMNHPDHVKKLSEIFPTNNEAQLGKHLTMVTLTANEESYNIVFDFSIPGIFKSLQKVSTKRRPIISFKTFKSLIIFIPLPNNQMKGLKFNLEMPGVKEGLKELAMKSTPSSEKPIVSLSDFNDARHQLCIDIYNQMFMNSLMGLTIDKPQTTGFSVLVWPGAKGEPWRSLSADDSDTTIWNILDTFSTLSKGGEAERVHEDGITVFDFNVYDETIAMHLNALWKTIPQLDVRTEKEFIFYLPFKPTEFSGLALNLSSEITVDRLKDISDALHLPEREPTLQIIGHEKYPHGLNINLNFDSQESFDAFIESLTKEEEVEITTTERPPLDLFVTTTTTAAPKKPPKKPTKIHIKTVGLIPVKKKYIVLLWDLAEVVESVLEVGESTKSKGKTRVFVPVDGQLIPIYLDLKDPVIVKLLTEIMYKTMIPFAPIRADVKKGEKFVFVLALYEKGENIPLVIEDTPTFNTELKEFSTKRSKKTYLFSFKSEKVHVDVTRREVIDFLLSKSTNTHIPEENKKNPLVIPHVTDDRFDFIHLKIDSKDDIEKMQEICNETAKTGTEMVIQQKDGKRVTVYCNFEDEDIYEQISPFITRVQTVPAKHSIAVLNLPDGSGLVHPLIFDLRLEAVRDQFRRWSRKNTPESINKVAIYYMDRMRYPETFVIDYDAVTLEQLKELGRLTPCSMLGTGVINPEKGGQDLVVFTIPKTPHPNITCDDGIPIILDQNNDLVVREIEGMEAPYHEDIAYIPITYKNNFKKNFRIPYLSNETIASDLRKLSVMTPNVEIPVMNQHDAFTIEFADKEGLIFMVVINGTSSRTKKVLDDITSQALPTVPSAYVRGRNHENFVIKLDLHDPIVQSRLLEIAVNTMQLPRENQLIVIKPPSSDEVYILDTTQETVFQALMEMNKQDKDKPNRHTVVLKDDDGNRKVVKLDLTKPENIEKLKELEKLGVHNSIMEIPDSKHEDAFVAMQLQLENGTEAVMLNVRIPSVVEGLVALNDPTNPKAVAIPVYTASGDKIMLHVDPWDEKVSQVLLELSKHEAPAVSQYARDTGFVDIPLEITKDGGVLIIQCNVTDPEIVEKLMKLPTVTTGDRNLVYVKHPETEEMISLNFDPSNTQLITQLKILCPITRIIPNSDQLAVIESFDDNCKPDTFAVNPNDTRLAELSDDMNMRSASSSKKVRGSSPYFYWRNNSDGSPKIVGIDPEDPNAHHVFDEIQKDMKMSIDGTVVDMVGPNGARKPMLLISLLENNTVKDLSFDISNVGVMKSLNHVDEESKGRGIAFSLSRTKSLILDVYNKSILKKLEAIYELYAQEFIKVPDLPVGEDGKHKEIIEDKDGDIVIKEVDAVTSRAHMPTIMDDEDDYLIINGEIVTEIPRAIDIPDISVDVPQEDPADIALRDGEIEEGSEAPDRAVNFMAALESTDKAVDFFEAEATAPSYPIDPPFTPGQIVTEPPATPPPIVRGVLDEDLVTAIVPKSFSLLLLNVQHRKLSGVLLFNLYDESVMKTFRQISSRVKLEKATHFFILQQELSVELIKLNLKNSNLIFNLIMLAKSTKPKLQPTEFPKSCGPGHFIVFTVVDEKRELRTVIIDSANTAAIPRLRKLQTSAGEELMTIVLSGSKPEQITVDIKNQKTVRDLLKITKNTGLCSEALLNVPIYDGIFSKVLRIPVFKGDKTIQEYIFDVTDPKNLEEIERASNTYPAGQPACVLYIKKGDITVPVKVDVTAPPKAHVAVVDSLIQDGNALVFFLGKTESDHADVVVLDRGNPEVIEELYNHVKKNLEITSMYSDRSSYSVFNIIHPDGYPLEIKLDLKKPDTIELINTLAELTPKPFTPFEVASAHGSRKLTVLCLTIDEIQTIIALNPNNKDVVDSVKELFSTHLTEVFHIIKEFELRLSEPEIAEKLMALSQIGITPQSVPSNKPYDFIFFSIIDENDDLLKLWIDIGEQTQVGKLIEISTDTDVEQEMVWKFHINDHMQDVSITVCIDMANKQNLRVLKELARATAFPTRHEVYPPMGNKPLTVISIPHFGRNYNLTIDPNDDRVITLMEHAYNSYPKSIIPKFPFVGRKGENIKVPLQSIEYAQISALTFIQIDPLTILLPNSKAPLLSMMIPTSTNDYACITLDVTNETTIETLAPLEPAEQTKSFIVVFHKNDGQKVPVYLDLHDDKTIETLKEVTASSGVRIIPRRFKYPLLKIYDETGEKIILDLHSNEVRSKLIAISRKTQPDQNITEIWLRNLEGLVQPAYVPFIDADSRFLVDLVNYPELLEYKLNTPIPEYYTEIQHEEPISISSVKVMLAHQRYPIMMLDMRTCIFFGELMGDISVDINQAQTMDTLESRRSNDMEKFSLFEVQDIDGNIVRFKFDFTNKEEIQTFRELNDISLIQFRSNDLGLPTLIIDLINEEKVEVDLNIEEYLGVLQAASEEEPSENAYKIQVPYAGNYIIVYIDFNDEEILQKLRVVTKTARVNPAVYTAPEEPKQDIRTFNFTDGGQNIWKISVDMNDYFMREQLMWHSLDSSEYDPDYFTLMVPNKMGDDQIVMLNRHDRRTLEFLKELNYKTTGEPAEVIHKYEKPKDFQTVSYTDQNGKDYDFILDLNNPKVIEELKTLDSMSKGLGIKVELPTKGSNHEFSTYVLNLEDPNIRRKMYELKESSVFGGQEQKPVRRKRSIEGTPFVREERPKTIMKKHFKNILRIDTPATGVMTLNFKTEDTATKKRLQKLATNTKTTHPLIVHLFDELQNPYSIQLDLMNTSTLREMLLINKELKKIPISEDKINQITYRFKTIETMDPHEKILYTLDTYNATTIKTLNKIINHRREGIKFIYFNKGQLTIGYLDTVNHTVKSVLGSISQQTLHMKNEDKVKLITLIFFEDEKYPIVLNLAHQKTVLEFLDIVKKYPIGLTPSYFEIRDSSGQYLTIPLDLTNEDVVDDMIDVFQLKESIKISHELKTYISMHIPTNSSYKTIKIPINTKSIDAFLNLSKLDAFTVKLKGVLDKNIVFYLDPTKQSLEEAFDGIAFELLPKTPSNFLSIYNHNHNKFFDVNLEDKKVLKYLRDLNGIVDRTLPITIVTLYDDLEYLYINIDDNILKYLTGLSQKDVGVHIVYEEVLEKLVNVSTPYTGEFDDEVQLDLGDLSTVRALQNMTYSIKIEPKLYYFDDAWGNPMLLKVEPTDINTINKLMNMNVR